MHSLLYHVFSHSVQRKADFLCAWCDMACGNIEGLVCHLSTCHDRYEVHHVCIELLI
jgi:hypothetical protein